MASIKEHVAKSGEHTWKVLYRLPVGDGKTKQTSQSFPSKRAAEKFRDRIHATSPAEATAWLDGLTVDATSTTTALTVSQLFDLWFEANKGDWTERVQRGYRRDYDNWVRPTFGDQPAAMIEPRDVQAWVDQMKAKTKTNKSGKTIPALGAKSIADRHAILSGMYKWGSATTRQHVPGSPCLETKLPEKSKTSVKGLRLQELKWLLAAGEQIGERDTADLTAFLAGTGWRISEAIGLTVGSVEIVDGPSGKPLVYVAMDRVYRPGQGLVEDAKSSASFQRRLRILGPGADVVARRIVGKGMHDPVFTFVDGRPGVRGQRTWNPTSYRERRLPKIVEAAGLSERGVTPHWLRHTHVAVCIASGLGLAEIQRRLGHENITTTIGTYGRMFEEMTQEMADRADLLMTPELNPNILGEVVRGEISETTSHQPEGES